MRTRLQTNIYKYTTFIYKTTKKKFPLAKFIANNIIN